MLKRELKILTKNKPLIKHNPIYIVNVNFLGLNNYVIEKKY